MQEVACNVAGYEQFLETRLRTDLYDASSLKQAFSDEQEDFRALEQNLHLLLKCTLQEASNIAADKQQQLQAKIDQQTNTISNIKARITLMQESIEAIQAV